MFIGSHVGMSSPHYLVGSCNEAFSYNATTFMFYTGAPQNTYRAPVNQLKIEEAKKILAEHNLSFENIIVHAPYLINLGNCEDQEKYELSIRLLKTEIERTLAIGSKYLVLHPGNALKATKAQAIQRISDGLNHVLSTYPNIVVLLETMAGKGSEVGSTFEEIKAIIDGVENKASIGVCLDTCHIHDAGYDLKNINQLVDDFDRIIGLDFLKVCHINDSKNVMGAKKDRHENFGLGHIGFETLISVIFHEKLKDKIFILETPWVTYEKDGNKFSYPPYKFEIEMIQNKAFNPNLIDDIFHYYEKK